jgi:4-amino-4-deoxy-L-arabinose transferase-like glycosyltransferase
MKGLAHPSNRSVAHVDLVARRLCIIANGIASRPRVAITLISILYFAVTLALAHVKPFWNDELYTFHIARLPGMRSVWDALLTGVEQLPPLFYAITKASIGIFGYTHIGMRLPEILGFWLMSVSLYGVARRFVSAPYAIFATVFPLLTGAFDYAYEARPYALVLGFYGCALWCWFEATGGSRRSLAVVGLVVSLAAALTCHYYAILGFLPLVAGESVRSCQRRRLDLPVLLAFLVALAPLVVLFPLIRAAHSYAATFWAKPHWWSMIDFYQATLYPSELLLFAVPLALVVHGLIDSEIGGVSAGRSSISLSGLVILLGFTLLPVGAVVLAKTITHAYTDRYAIIAVIGLTGVLVWGLSHVASNSTIPALLLAALGVALFGVQSVRNYQVLAGSARSYEQTLRFLGENTGGQPVAIQDPHLFLELSALWKGRPGLALVYLFDRDRSLAYTGTDDVELGLMTLKSWAPLHLEKFDDFVAKKSPILVYGYPALYGWLVTELERDGWRLTVSAHNGEQLLFLAKPPVNR